MIFTIMISFNECAVGFSEFGRGSSTEFHGFWRGAGGKINPKCEILPVESNCFSRSKEFEKQFWNGSKLIFITPDLNKATISDIFMNKSWKTM